MKNFLFQTVPVLHFGDGCLAELPGQITALRASKPMIVTDKGIVQAGLIAPVEQTLRQAGFDVAIFDAVVADPPEAIVLQAVEMAKAAGADIVIGLGGGSSLDTAKVVAALAVDGAQPLSDIYGIGLLERKGLPTILIPTTSGTGSEVTAISILTTGETTKAGIISPHLFADVALLDPALTTGLPASVTAATGIDAMVHAVESYTSRNGKNPVSDMLAIEALKLLTTHIETACSDGNNMQAREAMLRGSMLAGQAFANSPVGAIHALAYPLGGIYHIPHGLSNALVMPFVMQFNLEAAAPLYAELADALDLPRGCENSSEARAQQLIDYLEALAVKVQAPRKLREIGIAQDATTGLAEAAMLQTRLLDNNPREVTLADAQRIYDAAW
ncbi:iron-containing alcohol dehydrogenase [Sphingorhabdus sp. 109]|jgi:alcohol dehydrogenase class IV|uniref:iron-containing alcohol dehydrogenase n=1 Tax=Sphingorhabdus sp. 109 TaxID=2653173 RepID=UPI0012F31702|nr:iron-containing alcohol dehydrogenase [Sphingorhabdus sp. 109]VWX56065.1 Long-chain-alcohol dehydrogenase 1 [Sphingorhabdus sp. 109]